MKIKKILSSFLAVATMTLALTGCGSANGNSLSSGGVNSVSSNNAGSNSGGTDKGLSGKLVFAIWDNNLMEYIDSNDMAGKFNFT